jgi:hypothetical protein
VDAPGGAQRIDMEIGMKLPVRPVGDYLKSWRFTPQKPIKQAHEQRPAGAKRWLDDSYPQIAAPAKREDAESH